MKSKITFLTLLAVSTAMIASAQVVEYDDMYFNSKDRAKVQASKPLTLKNISNQHEVATAINPTDSYSARNVNPEYISQSTVNPSGSIEPAPYFIPDYTPTAINQNLNGNSSSSWNNCNCAMAGGNPYYGMMPGFGSFGSPYGYGSSMYGYNPYGYGGYNGFNSGWSSMMSIGFGMGMGSYYPYVGYGGSSWGMGMGGYPLMNYGFNYYGGGYGYGYNNYYPGNVVIINNGDYNSRGIAYGKRASRSSDLNNTINSSNRSTTMVTTDSQGRVRGSNGRVSGDTNSGSYYQSGWRTNPETSTSRSSNWSNSGRSGSESNSRSSTSSFFDNYGGSRSSNTGGGNSNFSSGGGSRSSGSVGGGSVSSGSSSGARRGRD
jgi:hypothetical protein